MHLGVNKLVPYSWGFLDISLKNSNVSHILERNKHRWTYNNLFKRKGILSAYYVGSMKNMLKYICNGDNYIQKADFFFTFLYKIIT